MSECIYVHDVPVVSKETRGCHQVPLEVQIQTTVNCHVGVKRILGFQLLSISPAPNIIFLVLHISKIIWFLSSYNCFLI